MKIRIIAVLAITSTLFAASCKKGGMSEETKTKMATFEADWKAMSEQMTTWGTTMNTRMEAMNKMMHDAMPMEGDMHGDMKMDHKEHMDMMGTDSASIMCNMIMMQMDAMKAGYKTAMDSVTAQTAEYAEWKKTTMEAKDEEAANAGLDQWNTKLAADKTMMEEWNGALTEMETNCKNVCDMMMKDMAGHDMK